MLSDFERSVLVLGETVDQLEVHRLDSQPDLAGGDARHSGVVETARGAYRADEAPEDGIDKFTFLRRVLVGDFTPRRAQIFVLSGLGDGDASPEPLQCFDGNGTDADDTDRTDNRAGKRKNACRATREEVRPGGAGATDPGDHRLHRRDALHRDVQSLRGGSSATRRIDFQQYRSHARIASRRAQGAQQIVGAHRAADDAANRKNCDTAPVGDPIKAFTHTKLRQHGFMLGERRHQAPGRLGPPQRSAKVASGPNQRLSAAHASCPRRRHPAVARRYLFAVQTRARPASSMPLAVRWAAARPAAVLRTAARVSSDAAAMAADSGPASAMTVSKCSSADANLDGVDTSRTTTSVKPASATTRSRTAGSARENMPPGPVGGPPLTRPCIIAAMPTHVIQGLCSGPAHTATARRPPSASRRWHSRSTRGGSSTSIRPMRKTTASNVPASRPVSKASSWATSALSSPARVLRRSSTIPWATSLATTWPSGPTAAASWRANSPVPAPSSRTRSPGWRSSWASSRRESSSFIPST